MVEGNCKLTIAVITMNRQDQLIEALESCVNCRLPQKTEFVIVDNASTDATKDAVDAFAKKYSDLEIQYECSDVNLGVGGGRSRAFELAQGEYVYFLDDDAVISEESRETFFVDTLNYLEKNKNVASLTTRIYDEMLVSDREVEASDKTKIDGLPIIFKYLGGSHFLRRGYFEKPLYFSIKYGCEEYAPAIQTQSKGYYHVFDEHVYIVHKPKVNKWIKGTASQEYVESCGCAVRYATKRMLYPVIFLPLLWAGYERRCQKYLSQYPGAKKKTDALVKEIMRSNKTKKISIMCVIKLVKEFGLTTL